MAKHEGRPSDKTNAIKHGTRTKDDTIKDKEGGLKDSYYDGRTAKGRWLKRWIDAVIEELGGEDNLSKLQKLVIEDQLKPTLIRIDLFNRWLRKNDELELTVTRGEKEEIPAPLRMSQKFEERLTKILKDLRDMANKDEMDEYEKAMQEIG